LPVAGQFANDSRLNNDGETLKIEDAANGTIEEFSYNDAPPWPNAADGSGYSLVLRDAASNPDPSGAAAWRSSALPGGSPDGDDLVPFPADPLGDADGNGTPDLIDYALGDDLGLGPIAPSFTMQSQEISPGVFEDRPTITYPISLGAENASVGLMLSTDLTVWGIDPADITPVSIQNLGDGRALVTAFVNPPLSDEVRLFYQLEVSD
jgi:hypothetical protein